MAEREPVTRTMKASEARDHWSEVINQVFRRETRVVVEKSGIPVAAIISAADLDRLNRLDAQRRADFKVLEASWEAFKDVPEEEVEREVARAVAEARRKLSAEREGAAGVSA